MAAVLGPFDSTLTVASEEVLRILPSGATLSRW
jgi:hypothetical protein